MSDNPMVGCNPAVAAGWCMPQRKAWKLLDALRRTHVWRITIGWISAAHFLELAGDREGGAGTLPFRCGKTASLPEAQLFCSHRPLGWARG